MSHGVLRPTMALLLVLLTTACSMTDTSFETLAVTGELWYRERIALPPAASVRLTLVDVAVADRAAPVLAERRLPLGDRQVPVDFRLEVPRSALKPAGRYAFRATIEDPAGRLMWTTDSAHMVDPSATAQDLGPLRLVRVTSSDGQLRHDAVSGPEWVVEDIDGGGIIDFSRVTLSFGAQGRISGLAGCNRYTGAYRQVGDTLQVSGLASTNRACVPALMDQEDRFLKVLGSARSITWGARGALVIQGPGGSLRARRAGLPDQAPGPTGDPHR